MKFKIVIDWWKDDIAPENEDELLETAMDTIHDAVTRGCVRGELNTTLSDGEDIEGWWTMEKEK